ncbi:MAG: aldolase/citrate lyase family protein [Kiritimatiellae bacterium]|nr:aldolase/citrate lyase family protein [Kiritimatiellia bacterium]
MANTKQKIQDGECAFGGWMLIPHPAIAEIMAGEGFDWIAVDMEHAAVELSQIEQIERALRPSGCDLLVRLDGINPVQAKHVLDAGAKGIIVPSVISPEDVDTMTAAVRYPPQGNRGTSLSRALDYGRNFDSYIRRHNDEVFLAVMLEHTLAADRADEILARPDIDAAFIGPYDLSASMGIPGQLDHPEVLAAEQKILEACRRHNIAPGYHVVPPEAHRIQERIDNGYRFIGCSLDTQLIMNGCRQLLKSLKGISF